MSISPALLSDIAPTGTLRVGINLGNPVIAQKGDSPDPKGVGPALGRGGGRDRGGAARHTPWAGVASVV